MLEDNAGQGFEKDFRNYIGKNADYYLGKWKLNPDGEAKTISMNWAAFFFPLFWAAYRKMYKVIFVTVGIFLVIDIISYAIGNIDFQINSAIGLISGIIFGLYGNYFYYQKAKRYIDKSKHNNSSVPQKLGGTNRWNIWLMIAILIIYSVVSVFLIEPLFAKKPTIEFGYDSADGEIVDETDHFKPLEEMHVVIYFSDGKGGSYEIVMEKEEGNTSYVYDQWYDEVPPDWPGVVNVMEAPAEEGKYVLKAIKNNEVSTQGTFTVEE